MDRTVHPDMPEDSEIEQAILRYVAKGGEHRCKKIVDALAQQFSLTTEQRQRRFPNEDNVFYHLCNAPCRSLVKRGLLESKSTGYYKLTRLGLRAINRKGYQ